MASLASWQRCFADNLAIEFDFLQMLIHFGFQSAEFWGYISNDDTIWCIPQRTASRKLSRCHCLLSVFLRGLRQSEVQDFPLIVPGEGGVLIIGLNIKALARKSWIWSETERAQFAYQRESNSGRGIKDDFIEKCWNISVRYQFLTIRIQFFQMSIILNFRIAI
jgi:hypothetical protein